MQLRNNKQERNFFKSGNLTSLLIILSFYSTAQDRDTNYIQPYTKMITGRAYLSQKYTIFGIDGAGGFREIQYRPNTKLSVGVGATYRALTLNVGYGFSFLNPGKEKGKTKYLDLQTHLYGAKWRFDLFGQFYKGYFIFPRGYGSSDINTFYKRPDLNVKEMGVSAYQIYNSKRFSYRAAFLQSEWQKKSAGSFLLGGSITYGKIRGDSAIVPAALAADYPQKDIEQVRYIEVGPGAGYAYTLVWKEHWFITASATLSLDLGFVEETIKEINKFTRQISPNFMFRSGIGYNSSNWNLNFFWVSNRTAISGQFPQGGYHVNTGNYRLAVAKRIMPGPKLKKLLSLVDKVLDRK